VADTIDRYELKHVLGTGSFATVWLAHDPALGFDVALKVLADNWARDPEMRHRFLTEARLILESNSTRMVRVYGVNETDGGVPYIIMSYADRGNLEERMDAQFATGESFRLDQTCALVSEIALAVADVHRRGLVHRDVKPANVLFQTDVDYEQVLLGDFGLARNVDNTAITMVAGSPGYIAPEQARGLVQLDQRADLYPLGIMIVEMLTCEPPTINTTMALAATQEPVDVAGHFREHEIQLPAKLEQLLTELLDNNPGGRPASAHDVSRRLLAIDNTGQFPPRPPQRDSEPREAIGNPGKTAKPVESTRLLPALGAAAVIVAIVIGLAALRPGGTDSVTTTTSGLPPNSSTTSIGPAEPIGVAEPGDLALSALVPEPSGAVADLDESEVGRIRVLNVALTVEDVLAFYESQDRDWTIYDQGQVEDSTIIKIANGSDAAQITLTPTALTGTGAVTNIAIIGAQQPQ